MAVFLEVLTIMPEVAPYDWVRIVATHRIKVTNAHCFSYRGGENVGV